MKSSLCSWVLGFTSYNYYKDSLQWKKKKSQFVTLRQAKIWVDSLFFVKSQARNKCYDLEKLLKDNQ